MQLCSELDCIRLAIAYIGPDPGHLISEFSYGPLLLAPLTLVGSVLRALDLFLVCSWYVLVSRLGTHTRGL